MSRDNGRHHIGTALSDWEPSVDVSESNGHMQVRAELPGLNPEDIDVNVSGDLLTIKGEKTSESEEEDHDFYRRKSFTGAFQQTIPLPAEADSKNVQASFKNGVLNITLPKTESTRSPKVEISAE